MALSDTVEQSEFVVPELMMVQKTGLPRRLSSFSLVSSAPSATLPW